MLDDQDNTVTITRPASVRNPDVQFRIHEWARVLQASSIISDATHIPSSLHSEFHYQSRADYFVDKPGKKFTRIVTTYGDGHRSVHAFVENATGKVVKAAGWQAPAKDKDGLAYRWDLMDDEERVLLYSLGCAGGIFYADSAKQAKEAAKQ